MCAGQIYSELAIRYLSEVIQKNSLKIIKENLYLRAREHMKIGDSEELLNLIE